MKARRRRLSVLFGGVFLALLAALASRAAPRTDAPVAEAPPNGRVASGAVTEGEPWSGEGVAGGAGGVAIEDEGGHPGAAAAGEESREDDPGDPREAQTGGWMARVDAFFAKWLVEPLGAVLLFDFGTERLLGTKVPLIVLWLLAGALFFTLRMGFINIRAFWHAIRLTKGDYDDPDEPGEVTHFQALSSALSATVGLGNIAGVAIAVASGGPGATFWLILVGFLGMSSKFAECTLGQVYRKVAPDGTVSGGPMHYLKNGLAERGWPRAGMILGVLFAVLCVGGSISGGCAFQVGQSMGLVRDLVPWLQGREWIYGLAMSVVVGIVIIGGIRRIAATAEKIVPLMCVVYVGGALFIILSNYDMILPAFGAIFREAFTPDAAYGGFLGVMVIGITRAVFSNEAGIGSASIAHAAARTDEPVSEGIVALLEPFIDTVVVCTITSLVIIITGVYVNPEYARFVQDNDGAALTAAAFRTVIPAFDWILGVAVVLFAYSTMISWSYYGERCWTYLFGPRASFSYKVFFLCFVMLGSIVTASNILEFANMMILAMAFPNILGAVILSGKIRRVLDDYWSRYKGGQIELRRKTS